MNEKPNYEEKYKRLIAQRNEYNKKHYVRINTQWKKDTAKIFTDFCEKYGYSKSGLIQLACMDYIKRYEESLSEAKSED